MRSFDAYRLLKQVSLATALVVGASASLPFAIYAETQVAAQDGIFRESVLLQLFSERADEMQEGFVEDARGNFFRNKSISVQTNLGTHTLTTKEMIDRGHYLDSTGSKPVIRTRAGTTAHPFDPILFSVSAEAKENKYYDFGGRFGANGMSAVELARLRAQIQAMGGQVETDSNGNIIRITFGNSGPGSHDQLYSNLMAFFNNQGQNNGAGGAAVIVTPGGADNSGTGLSDEDSLARLRAILAGRGAGGSDFVYAPGGNTSGNGSSIVITPGVPSGPSNSNANSSGGAIIVTPGSGANSGGAGSGGVIVGNAGNGNQAGTPGGVIVTNPGQNGNTSGQAGNQQTPGGIIISGGNGNQGATNGARYGVGPDGRIIILDNSKPAAGTQNSQVTVQAGGANAPAGGVSVSGGASSGQNAGAQTASSGPRYGVGPNGQIIVLDSSNGAQGSGQQASVQVTGSNPGNGVVNGGHFSVSQSGNGYQITSSGVGSGSSLIVTLGGLINSTQSSYVDKAYNYHILHSQLGLDAVLNDRIRNMSDIEKSKSNVSFWVGEPNNGFKYAFAKVQTKEGGLFGIGAEHEWVLTQEVVINGEKSYRLVSAEEHAMIAHYLESKKSSSDDWEKIYKKFENEGLNVYDKKDYDRVREKALDASKSFNRNFNPGQNVLFAFSYYGSNPPMMGSTIGVQSVTTAPGAGNVQVGGLSQNDVNRLNELRGIFLSQYPNGSDRDFAAWMVQIVDGNKTTGNANLDQWVVSFSQQPQRPTAPTVVATGAPSAPAAVAATSNSSKWQYHIVATDLKDDNGVALFEVTRFKLIAGREREHSTEFLTQAQIDALQANASASTPASSGNAATPEAQVDENLRRLNQIISSVNTSWLDAEGNIVGTGSARLEPGISVAAFLEFAESQGSKVNFNENEDLRAKK